MQTARRALDQELVIEVVARVMQHPAVGLIAIAHHEVAAGHLFEHIGEQFEIFSREAAGIGKRVCVHIR